jgi:type I restriction enzyme S subunit
MSEQTSIVREALPAYAPEAPEPERVPLGYKQTEVGVIPEDWGVTTLGEIGVCLIGLTYTPSDVKPTGLLVLRSSNIGSGGLQFEDNVFVDVDVPEKLFVRDNDILICVRNGSRELVGKSIIIDERAIGMTFGAFMSVFRSPHNRFVFYQFQSETIKRQIHARLGATINQITSKSLKSFHIPFPGEQEQRAIATALSDVDALISALDKLIAKKRDVKTAAMQQLLTGKQRLPGFSGEWEVKRLGEICQIVSGGTPSTAVPAFWNGEIPWCTPTDITENDAKYLFGTNRTITEEGLRRSSATLLPRGALLLCTRATVGEIKIASVPVCTNQGFKSLVCGSDVSNEFLFYKLVTLKDRLRELGVGSTFLEVSRKDVAALKVPLPKLEEQTAIATVLSDMDAEIEALEARREKTRQVKEGMMQELLTGRTRLVRVGPGVPDLAGGARRR